MSILDDELLDEIIAELAAVVAFETFLQWHDLDNLTNEEQNKLIELYEKQKPKIKTDAGY